VKLSGNRKQRTRLTFILAQTYHQEDNYSAAQKTYARVLKLNPDFQMAFQARINMAMAFDTESGDARFILSELEGMLKDNQNREFRDQIYYALAQFSMRRNDTPKAIEYYNLALENYRGNSSQKGVTFLRLGEIYFDRKEYRQSASMYDSTMVYLSREYPDYETAGRRNLVLKELATYLNVIEREDSLQRLASLGTTERNAILDQIIEDIQEEERLEREREQERALMRQQMARDGRSRTQTAGTGEGGWYFYNPSAISFGQNEFYAKWGERELGDLWRISNKRIMAFGDTGEFGMDEDEMQEGGRLTRASLMENIPTTPEKMQASNARLARAYYNTGIVFKEKLNDRPAAIESFETLITRFPESEHKLYSAYFLYTMFGDAGNTIRAQTFKNLIIDEFPDTDFAKILSDPNYAENVRARQAKVKQIYSNAFDAYQQARFSEALSLIEEAEKLEQSIDQAGQFSFLKALVIGKTKEPEEFVESLVYVTENFVGTPVHEPAENLLVYLGSSGIITDPESDGRSERRRMEDLSGEDADIMENTPFLYRPESVHFYVMVIDTRGSQIRQLRADINEFNRDTFSDDNLNISTLFFDDKRQLVTITNFADAKKALDYGAQLNDELIKREHDDEHYQGFIISVDNYPIFYQERKLDEYVEFYNVAYSFEE
ncbi:MAG: tetratricopeptide repeat protein, partial [Bacteroidales bacterium]